MPTLEHNGIVEMFRENPGLAPRFLAMLFHLDVPPYPRRPHRDKKPAEHLTS